MFDSDKLQAVVHEYQKSHIQSEAEVRSKLIVPLLDFLGYPSELRAEEFPVHGFGGRKKLPPKSADFLLFSDPEFAGHREFTKKNREWLFDHSLLVVEAKKPGEMPDILGQAEFYTVWTHAVAYLTIDGDSIIGYYRNPTASDSIIIECEVTDLVNHPEIWRFSYESLLQEKAKGIELGSELSKTSVHSTSQNLSPDESTFDSIPKNLIDHMRQALGKNSEGLTSAEVVNRFLKMTNSYLDCQMRYDIPEYMFGFPRTQSDADLFLDGKIIPATRGKVTTYFWEDYDRYSFENDYIEISVLYKNNVLLDFDIGYHVWDSRVDTRLSNLEFVKKCLLSDTINIMFSDTVAKNILLPCGNPQGMWETKHQDLHMIDFWIEGMKKLLEIEKFYEIKFNLKRVDGFAETEELYLNIDYVYDGIALNPNCTISIPGGFADEDIEITEPTLFQENVAIPLPDRNIHGVTFRPVSSAIMPGMIPVGGTTTADILRISGCCLYEVIQCS